MQRVPMHRRSMWPAVVAAVVGAALLLAVQAGAGVLDPLTGAVSGTHAYLGEDTYCPTNPDPRDGEELHRHVSGVVATHPGEQLEIDACEIFNGALGGVEVQGSFTLSSARGTASGTMHGFVAFQARDHLDWTLTITSAARGFKPVIGRQLIFTACAGGGTSLDHALLSTSEPAFVPCL